MYKEIEKIRLDQGSLVSDSAIVEESHCKSFIHTTDSKQNPETQYCNIKVSKSYGAGVNVSIFKRGRRYQEMSVELGKSEIEMLIRFLQSVELKDYHGEYVPTKLIQL